MHPPIVAVSGFGQEEVAQAERAWLRRAIYGAIFGGLAGVAVSEFFASKKGEADTAKMTRHMRYGKYGAMVGAGVGLVTTI